MQTENGRINRISAILNFLAGVIFILAAFHIFTGGTQVDYALIAIGAVFLILGLVGWLFPRPAKKP